MEYKYLIVIKDGIIEIEGEIYQKIFRKEKLASLKEAKKKLKRFEKEYSEKEIIIKEYFKGKWKEIKV